MTKRTIRGGRWYAPKCVTLGDTEFIHKIRKVGGETKKRKKKKGPHLILAGKLGKLIQIRKIHWVN